MPRPQFPKRVPTPKRRPFNLSAESWQEIGATIGVGKLSVEDAAKVRASIEGSISCFQATEAGSATTTVANTRLVLKCICGVGRARRQAIEVLADERAGVDDVTHDRLHELARKVLAGDQDKDEALIAAARLRLAELDEAPRVEPQRESLRYFCASLRGAYEFATNSLAGSDRPRYRRFARAVLATVNGDLLGNFLAHPDRLDDLIFSAFP